MEGRKKLRQNKEASPDIWVGRLLVAAVQGGDNEHAKWKYYRRKFLSNI